MPDESSRGQARMTRRDRRHQRAGGCRDAGLAGRSEDLSDPMVRTGPDVRVDLDVAAAASSVALVSGEAMHAILVPSSSSMSRHSPSAATDALRTDARSRPRAS